MRRRNDDAQIYDHIKAGLTEYEYPPGKRISVRVIAGRLKVSTKSVRRACRQLAGEGWAIETPHADYYAWCPEDRLLTGSYTLSRSILTKAIDCADFEDTAKHRERAEIRRIHDKVTERALTNEALATAIGDVFLAIVALADHPRTTDVDSGVLPEELMEGVNKRLYYIRTLECEHLDDPVSELAALCKLALAGHRAQLKQAIIDYHRRRRALLPKLPKLLAAQHAV
jgi:DNA-binding GntR family transcriptional regulator